MNKKFLNVNLYIWLAFISLSLLFILFPQIDLYVSSFFYDGERFYSNGTLWEDTLNHSVKPILILSFFLPLSIFIYNKVTKKSILGINSTVMLYIVLILAIAPGVFVNLILKDHWGRERPTKVTQFGGHKEFTPAFIMTKTDGHSFSSGHAAAAFSLIGFALLAPRRKKVWMTLAVLYGVGVSLSRVAAGGHFLSDVITSFFIVWITTHILYYLIFKKESSV
ncbi:phosphatase PAP2 family protein [Sulfurimonas sp.]